MPESSGNQVRLDVKVETEADGKQIFVESKEESVEVGLNAAGKGRIEIRKGKRYRLRWKVVGTPGTSYKITLTPQTDELIINGKHPVDLKIHQGTTRAGGHRIFAVVEE